MRKIFLFFAVLICSFALGTSAAKASTLEQALGKVAQRLFINTDVNKNVLRLYKDWGFIDKQYIDVFAGALHSGLICPRGNLLNPKSNDLSPLIDGLLRFSMTSPTFDMTGFYGSDKTDFTPDTIFIVDGQLTTDFKPIDSQYYRAIVNRGGRTYVVWRATDTSMLWLYRGSLFLKEDGEYIIHNAQKKSFNTWQSISDSEYTKVVMSPGVEPTKNKSVITDDINLHHLDKQVFIIGQHYDNGKIKADYFEVKD